MNYKILIYSVMFVGFAIMTGLVWTSMVMRDVTVVEHPYEAGIAYDATQKRYAELGWKVISPVSANKDGQLNVSVYDRNGTAMDNATVEFMLNRIGNPDIKKYRAERTEHGMYSVHADFSSKGYWELRVNVTQGKDTLSYDSKIKIDG